ncbi:NAD(P)H-dependent oxidoreductase [Photobacterium galatheae]|uniref:NADPH-dependent FMN reductase n=1 Tax=Photobacterium galatheae TaxID=1654360 RepID=UPI00202CA759|nr:NAD(P)H-dependent oxidoreductase [Photobacterium galatheae]MCM0147413.1 NAD(P)H-dependent oxidoreductase [Photobacterium galatheae]
MQKNQHQLLIIYGSTRPNRGGLPVAHWVLEQAKQAGTFAVAFADLKTINLPLLDEPEHPAQQKYTKDHTKAWSQMVSAADAVLFVTPEYDYFPPAALVNAIQFLAKEWAGKPMGIVSYGGVSGGLRSTQALRLLLSAVNHMTLSASVPIAFYQQYITDDGVLEANEPMKKGLSGLLAELHRMTVLVGQNQ